MDLVQFAKAVLGVNLAPSRAHDGDMLPPALRTLYLLNSKLPESVLQTNVRVLEPAALYDLGPYHIFAEEAQCVSWWGFKEPRDDAESFVITEESPVKAFREDFPFSEVLLAMVIQNVLSTSLLDHYRYSRFSGHSLDALVRQVPVAGGFLNAKAMVVGSVACVMEVDEVLFLCAASRSAEKLAAFFAIVEATLGPELPD
jgi:hypothetical protein